MNNFDINWSHKHDIYNLIYLPIIVLINLYVIFNHNVDTIKYFMIFFLGYLLIDFTWILLVPSSVSSPNIILLHHIVTVLGIILIPYLDKNTQYIILLGSLVETNTLVRIIRKFYRENLFLNILFYSTWFLIRCVLGPILLFYIINNICDNYNKKNILFYQNILLLCVGLILNILNIKWTFELYNGGWKKLLDKNSKGL